MPTFAPSIYCKKPFLPLSAITANTAISLISQLLCKESNERCILCYKLTYIKKGKGNSIAIFADTAVLNHYRKNRTNYRNTKQAAGVGRFLYFDCNSFLICIKIVLFTIISLGGKFPM
jgi:hypothetical protein